MTFKKEKVPLFEATQKDPHDFKPHASIDMSEDANNSSMQAKARISVTVASGGGNRSLKNQQSLGNLS